MKLLIGLLLAMNITTLYSADADLKSTCTFQKNYKLSQLTIPFLELAKMIDAPQAAACCSWSEDHIPGCMTGC